MSSWLDIIIPAEAPDGLVATSVASLISQTDRSFSVILSECVNHTGISDLDESERLLQSAGITVRRLRAPFQMQPTEHWNWAHSQASGAWLKMLLPGEKLKPAFAAALKARLNAQPNARVVRCDTQAQMDWGSEVFKAPFERERITPIEFLYHFPRRFNWINSSVNIAYSREAWLSTGGFARHLPATASLNLNAILSLHYGLENIPDTLVEAYSEKKLPHQNAHRFSRFVETWLILRQARNYCLATKLPWPKFGVAAGIWRMIFQEGCL